MKDIPGFEGEYAVTSCGKVWSYKSKKFLAQRYDKNGYLRVTLCHEGKMITKFVHQLVAMAYIPNPEGKKTVNHKDEVKTHNYLNNLEWMTHKENLLYGTGRERACANGFAHGQPPKKVYCVELDKVFNSIREAAQAIGMTGTNISACCRNRPGFKTCGGYHWRYYEEEVRA